MAGEAQLFVREKDVVREVLNAIEEANGIAITIVDTRTDITTLIAEMNANDDIPADVKADVIAQSVAARQAIIDAANGV